MTTGKSPRIIIAGGSIAGLSLALMLERLGVDFVMLERNGDMSPQVGASIALSGNALRIWDQLGCCDDVLDKAKATMQTASGITPDGHFTIEWPDFSKSLVQRFGYPAIILDRQMVLEVLHSHVKDKSKIFMNKKVVSVSNSADCVEVTTQDGCTYTGDILVGADGIHSRVRKEMWRIADEAEPGWTNEEEQHPVSASYSCMFGISVMKSGIPPGIACNCYNENRSLAVLTGVDHRIYWFYSKAFDKTLYKDEIPRFTDDDCETFAKEHWDDPAHPGVTFGDLYSTRIRAVLTPLHSHVFRKWHYGRIITIGDAAHKYVPTGGQGGAQALESAAVLANQIMAALRVDPALSQPNTIPDLFTRTQALRWDRADSLRKQAEMQLYVEAMRNPLCKFITLYVTPRIGSQLFIQKFTEAVRPAAKLDDLPVPERSKKHMSAVGFLDQWEKTDTPAPWDERGVRDLCAGVMGFLAACVGFGALLAVLKTSHPASTETLAPFPSPPWTEMLTPGLVVGGGLLASMGTTNATESLVPSPSAFGFEASSAAAIREFLAESRARPASDAYFAVMATAPLTVMLLEGYRNANTLSLLQWPLPWALLATFAGWAPVLPLYFLTTILLDARTSPDDDRINQLALSRRISPHLARVVAPVVGACHLLPSLLAYVALPPPLSALLSVLRSPLATVACCAHLATAPLLPASRTAYTRTPMDLVPVRGPLDLRRETAAAAKTASGINSSRRRRPFLSREDPLAIGLAVIALVLALTHIVQMGVSLLGDGCAGFAPTLRAELDAWPSHVACIAWLVFHACEVRGRVAGAGGGKKGEAGEAVVGGEEVWGFLLVVVGAFAAVGPGASVLGAWWVRERVLDELAEKNGEHGVMEETKGEEVGS